MTITLTHGFCPNEFAQLYAIEQECFPVNKVFTRVRMLRYLWTSRVVVARHGKTIAGYIIVTERNTSCYVVSLAVTAKYRGLGIARRLMKEAESAAPQKSWWLHVYQDNPAQKLYFDLGYRVTKVIPKFYAPRQTALVMRKVK